RGEHLAAVPVALLADLVAQRLRRLVGVGVEAVDDGHRADEHLARRERADQPDADLPVEAERLDRRLEGAAEAPGEAVVEARALLGGVDLREALVGVRGGGLDDLRALALERLRVAALARERQERPERDRADE